MTATELVPVENMAALEAMPVVEREIAVTGMLSEARQWLAHAVEATEPSRMVEFKAWARTVAETTKQLKLSREIQLDAAEMVVRAQRGVGQSIRLGQQRGEIRTPEDTHRPGVNVRDRVLGEKPMTSPAEVVPADQERSDIYAMTDNVTDEQFDEALEKAKTEGNVSRANVVRKIRGDDAPKGDRPSVLRGTHRLNSNRIVSGVVLGALVPTSVLEHVDYAALDRDQLSEWIDSLTESIKALSALRKRLATEHEKEPIQ